jgi:ubiquinone/menaquinone biosynthesis C-methylase UbiE
MKKNHRAKPVREKKEDVLELELLSGLLPFVLEELKAFKDVKVIAQTPEAVRISASNSQALFSLRRVVAVYKVLTFAIPRPKALLGDEHLRRLLLGLGEVVALQPEGAFSSFRLSAAGQDSSVFQRLKEVLAKQLQLPHDPDDGNLFIRIRPGEAGWEVLIRLTPRPLSARAYRVCNLPGGLNAGLAAAMNDFVGMASDDRYLNAMCGSGTLLIERALAAKAKTLLGLDLSAEALECAAANAKAAGLGGLEFLRADATQLPFLEASFDAITADLPWGDVVGSHAANAQLYPAFLTEMARISVGDARFCVLTHEIKLFERILREQSSWAIKASIRVFHGGHYPRMYLLEKIKS